LKDSAHSVVDAVVAHRRSRPRENAFRYRVAYLCLSLDALDSAAGRWLKLDRPGLVSFRRADHGGRDGGDLKAWLRGLLDEHGLGAVCNGDAVLMTMPRMLGYVFNPVSFWFCRDRAGGLRAVLCEVNNTFGETHCYLVHHADHGVLQADEWFDGRKAFHVSPFLPVEGNYRFRFRLDGPFEPLADRTVLRRFLGNPTMTLGVVARIHWQALKLWRKRARFYRKPAPPPEFVTR